MALKLTLIKLLENKRLYRSRHHHGQVMPTNMKNGVTIQGGLLVNVSS